MQSSSDIYFDIEPYYDRAVFTAVYGGRGIGKTYSALKMGLNRNLTILYLRRTEKQLNLSFSKRCNPYKKINLDMGKNITVKSEGEVAYAVDENEPSKVIAYGASLSTFYNISGIDFSDVDLIVFDEFQRRINERPMKNEGKAFLELYESVARNREIEGREPLKVLFYSNAVSVYSEVLIEFGLEDVVEKMLNTKKNRVILKEKSVQILVLDDSLEISRRKGDTALYRAVESDYKDYAIGNMFTDDSFYNVKSMKLTEYRPLFSVDEIYFYEHKSKPIWYACYSRADCPRYNRDNMVIFRRQRYPYMREMFLENRIYYKTYSIKKSVEKIIWGG